MGLYNARKEGITQSLCETGRLVVFPIGDMLYIRGVVCIVYYCRSFVGINI